MKSSALLFLVSGKLKKSMMFVFVIAFFLPFGSMEKRKNTISRIKFQGKYEANFQPTVKPRNSSATSDLSRNISTVLEELLMNYDNRQRPDHGGSPTVVTTNFLIRSMGPISELDMEYSMDCYFRQKWTDRRLMFGGPIKNLSLSIKMLEGLWKPDTYFHNGKGSYLHTITLPNKLLRIFQNGEVLYSMRLTIKATCPMLLQNFPMDKQSCPLVFGSYGYTVDHLRYQWDPKGAVSLNEGLVLSQYDLIDFPIQNGTVTAKTGMFSVLQINFNLRRHMGYFLIQVYVPCILIVVLSWVSFWINREATADRVGLGITTVLTLSTFGLDTKTDLPKVSYPTALDWFVIMCFTFVIATLLEFAGVHYFTKIGSGEYPCIQSGDESDTDDGFSSTRHLGPTTVLYPSPIPRACRRKRSTTHIPNCRDLRICCIQFWNCFLASEKYKAAMRRRVAGRTDAVNSVSKIDEISRILFPCCFLALNFFYWFIYGSKHQSSTWENM
ncbi:gamma-aminobutyric acid receptor alpha-like isoform X2 [Uloborus diversus]|uniref:gamma-aminobutyric acid receptor alpha-like isoform X2 n=1 Tax=Uloborus diversus TaxID=327109 RepID=UPI002409C9EA|nr:gamma-aminobutyric acid receptor alpha-like isoform X2 [Uloborus diversus]